MSTRRDFLARSASGAAALAAGVGGPLILTPRKASAQQSTAPNDIGDAVYAAQVAYRQAGISDGLQGYQNPQIWNVIANSVAYLQYKIEDWGQGDQIAQGIQGLPATPDQMDPTWFTYIANQCQISLPVDFFTLVPLGDLTSEGIWVNFVPVNGGDFLNDMGAVVWSMQQWATGNYWALNKRLPRPGAHLEKAFFQNGNTGRFAAVGAIGVGMIGGGAAAVTLGVLLGGTGVLTGAAVSTSAIAAAAAVAIAWTGVGLLILGTVVATYAAYRLLTMNDGGSTVWTKPTDMPVQTWNQRWSNGGAGGFTYPPNWGGNVPNVYSTICYPACS